MGEPPLHAWLVEKSSAKARGGRIMMYISSSMWSLGAQISGWKRKCASPFPFFDGYSTFSLPLLDISLVHGLRLKKSIFFLSFEDNQFELLLGFYGQGHQRAYEDVSELLFIVKRS